MKEKVGVIGAGNIGFGICSNLLKAGFELAVYDIRPEPLEELRKQGAIIASDPANLGRQCQTVFLVLLDYQQNLAVIEGPDGLLENMAAGGCIFLCSTISPSEARDLADRAATQGLKLMDCPVSGGYGGAMAGTLTLMIGGDRSSVNSCLPALEAISKNLYFLSEVGAGATAKVVNNLLVAVHLVATGEALLLAKKSGIDLNLMFNIISKSAGQSWIFDKLAIHMIERDFSSRGVLKILLKDTNIMNDLARGKGLVLPLANLSQQIFQVAINQGLGDEDASAVIKVLEGLADYSLEDNTDDPKVDW